MNKALIHTALVAAATYIVIAAVQKHVMPVPVLGAYLPNAQ